MHVVRIRSQMQGRLGMVAPYALQRIALTRRLFHTLALPESTKSLSSPILVPTKK